MMNTLISSAVSTTQTLIKVKVEVVAKVRNKRKRKKNLVEIVKTGAKIKTEKKIAREEKETKIEMIEKKRKNIRNKVDLDQMIEK